MNYLDAFGDEIYSRCAETKWPEAVLLDTSPQREKDLKESGAKKQGGKRVFAILGTYGYANGLTGGGKLWRLAVHGAEDQVEWERFLTSMPGQPRWAVCDGSSAIANAVRVVWKGTVIYNCEWHIAHSGDEKLRPAELGGRYSVLVRLVRRSVMGPTEWSELEMAVATLPAVPRRLDRWMRTPAPRAATVMEPAGCGHALRRRPVGGGVRGDQPLVPSSALPIPQPWSSGTGSCDTAVGARQGRRRAAPRRDHQRLLGGETNPSDSVGRWRDRADPKGTGSSVREIAKQAAQRIAREKALTAQRQAHNRAAKAFAQGQSIFPRS